MMTRRSRQLWLLWVGILAIALGTLYVYQAAQTASQKWTLSELATAVRQGNVREIRISGDESRATVKVADGGERIVLKERGVDSFLGQLGLSPDELGTVDLRIDRSSGLGDLAPLLTTLVPFVLMLGFLMFMMR